MPDMKTILVSIWLIGWAGATIFAAAVIGYLPNQHLPIWRER